MNCKQIIILTSLSTEQLAKVGECISQRIIVGVEFQNAKSTKTDCVRLPFVYLSKLTQLTLLLRLVHRLQYFYVSVRRQ